MKAAVTTFFVYRTWLGDVCIGADANGIGFVSFETFEVPGARRMPTALTNRASTQILEYLAGKRRTFDVPITLCGSPFALQVLGEVANLPYGETATATGIAQRIGQAESYRSIGRAIRSNPIELIIPTHRIVDANGKAIGSRLQAQHAQALIEFERFHRDDA